ncbi:putative tRNA (cytidine(34)-2'-O)-methyltransferase [Porphyridium purpureum]|uniref:Putative tRNA (Cytidine(34)-2'-O)-methyltransferase n=1 Tax=Porphyridium purpureum TaxID=35688 RepID=A0A5J4YR67_PORPP|nr:putative tRNA (cytidine(34)-2'-O)-methyltransferase [Porphyridium purpureum]|eukprot:POR1385..scf222_8
MTEMDGYISPRPAVAFTALVPTRLDVVSRGSVVPGKNGLRGGVSSGLRSTRCRLACCVEQNERVAAPLPPIKLRADGHAPFGKGAAIDQPLLDDTDGEPLLHIVFVTPQIHWNTGNIGRTCMGFGARLHVVGPIGFSLEDKQVRRAGLDYWQHVDLRFYESWDAFLPTLATLGRRLYFTKYAHSSMLDVTFDDSTKTVLIFGSEVTGLTSIRGWLDANEDPANFVAYPMHSPEQFRSFNLSTSASMALWEAYKTITLVRRSRAL